MENQNNINDVSTITNRNQLNQADLCRANGWTVGTILEGDEGYGPYRIKITAIGETVILARRISCDGKPYLGRETIWSLARCDWKKVDNT